METLAEVLGGLASTGSRNHRIQINRTTGVVRGELVSTAACDDELIAKPQSVLEPNGLGLASSTVSVPCY